MAKTIWLPESSCVVTVKDGVVDVTETMRMHERSIEKRTGFVTRDGSGYINLGAPSREPFERDE